MIKGLVLLVIAVFAILYIQDMGNPGLLSEFAEFAGDAVTRFINWLGGEVDSVSDQI